MIIHQTDPSIAGPSFRPGTLPIDPSPPFKTIFWLLILGPAQFPKRINLHVKKPLLVFVLIVLYFFSFETAVRECICKCILRKRRGSIRCRGSQ